MGFEESLVTNLTSTLHQIVSRRHNHDLVILPKDQSVEKLVTVCTEVLIVFGDCFKASGMQSLFAFFSPVIRALPSRPDILVMQVEDTLSKFLECIESGMTQI